MAGKNCCCLGSSSPANVCIYVYGCCNNLRVGDAVEIRNTGGGSVVCSGVTDSDGKYCCSLAFGTYDYTVTPTDPEYSTATGSVVHATDPTHKSVFLAAASGYVCGPCDMPIPTTMILNDGIGDITMTYSSSEQLWYGCATRTLNPPNAGTYYGVLDPTACTAITTASYPVTITVGFTVTYKCPAQYGYDPQFDVSVVLPRAQQGGVGGLTGLDGDATCAEFNALSSHNYQSYTNTNATCSWGGWANNITVGIGTIGASWSDSCSPILVEVTSPLPFGGFAYRIWGPTVTFTFSE